MIKIKETKSVAMYADEVEVHIIIGANQLSIPIKSVFQVKRGLESYVQKFYRKTK